MMKIKVLSHGDRELSVSGAGERASLLHTMEYQAGDRILLETNAPGFYVIQLEDTMPPALVWIPGNSMIFHVPPADNRPNYSPKSFAGNCHLLRARPALKEEISSRRNLALNVYDQHENSTFFPHAFANVETRGEAVFAARNAIDGICENTSHGNYPYQSWGINRNPEAALTVNFGREVNIDAVSLTLRGDYPHDNYWVSGKISFSDGSSEVLELTNDLQPQHFPIAPRKVTGFTLDTLIMAPGPSPFPALTQIEAWGTERI